MQVNTDGKCVQISDAPIPESESIPESALFLLESELESEISKGAGIGTRNGIREFGLGIGIRNFKSDHILILRFLEYHGEVHVLTGWNRNRNGISGPLAGFGTGIRLLNFPGIGIGIKIYPESCITGADSL